MKNLKAAIASLEVKIADKPDVKILQKAEIELKRIYHDELLVVMMGLRNHHRDDLEKEFETLIYGPLRQAKDGFYTFLGKYENDIAKLASKTGKLASDHAQQEWEKFVDKFESLAEDFDYDFLKGKVMHERGGVTYLPVLRKVD